MQAWDTPAGAVEGSSLLCPVEGPDEALTPVALLEAAQAQRPVRVLGAEL